MGFRRVGYYSSCLKGRDIPADLSKCGEILMSRLEPIFVCSNIVGLPSDPEWCIKQPEVGTGEAAGGPISFEDLSFLYVGEFLADAHDRVVSRYFLSSVFCLLSSVLQSCVFLSALIWAASLLENRAARVPTGCRW